MAYFAMWNGSAWSNITNYRFNAYINKIVINSTDMYIGGAFTALKGQNGLFDISSNSIINCESFMSTKTWRIFGATGGATPDPRYQKQGVSGYVNSIRIYNNYIYCVSAGGEVFSENQYRLLPNGVQYFSFNTNLWYGFGPLLANQGITPLQNWSGVNGTVSAIDVDSSENVYIGGNFTKAYVKDYSTLYIDAYSLDTRGIVKWSNNNWSYIGRSSDGIYGIAGTVNSVKVINNILYIGGYFTSVYDQSTFYLTAGTNITIKIANHIIMWDLSINNWECLGNISFASNDLIKSGVTKYYNYTNISPSPPYIKCLTYSGNKLYIGGVFDKLCNKSVNGIFSIDV